jgi:hypothetical protein
MGDEELGVSVCCAEQLGSVVGWELVLVSILVYFFYLFLFVFILLVLLQQLWRFVFGFLSSGARQLRQPACLLPSALEPILGPRRLTV